MRRFAAQAGVAAFVLAVLMLVPGCPVQAFQVFFMNDGEYPVVSVLITPADNDDWGDNLLGAPVPAGQSVTLPWKFTKGAVYDVAVVFDAAPESAEGNLVPLFTQMDTSGLNSDYVTLWADYRRDGAHGVGYSYGLPE